jgi:hypothetical protein
MNTTTEILKTLSDAVTASGKKLSDIGKEPIFEFLKRNETPKNLWEGIYEKLLQIHNHVVQKPKLDYLDNSHNDVKHREPRKKVFSEIKKIAG